MVDNDEAGERLIAAIAGDDADAVRNILASPGKFKIDRQIRGAPALIIAV